MEKVFKNKGVRKTYPQDWAAYNAAQTYEKEIFLNLIDNLFSSVPELKQIKGRPRIPIHDALFMICYKIFSTLSGRRFMSDLRDAQEKGYIKRIHHFNSIFNYLENEQLTEILYEMIRLSSLPLSSIEEDFAVDSSGFGTSRHSEWIDHKYGKFRYKDWVKVHLICGVKTNVVTAVEIRDKYAADAPILPCLVERTAESFSMREVSGDKAYGSYKNYDAIAEVGSTPYIPFKEYQSQDIRQNLKSELWGHKIKKERKTKNALWNKMYHYFQYNQEEFMEHYHKRSNVETVFSMIKAKFGGNVRSKTDTAMINEVLCKVICHNVCVLIQESHELGISDVLKPAQKVT